MNISVLGLISIDNLAFAGHKSYVGGGGLATAWVSSLWQTPTTLFSVSCNDDCNRIINKNLGLNSNFFSHVSLSKSQDVPNFEIERNGEDFIFRINKLLDIQNCLELFLNQKYTHQYIKLPASSFLQRKNWDGDFSVNPQGKFNLQEFNKTVKTNGFVILNYAELRDCSGLSLLEAMQYIESIKRSFVITLGRCGAICYYSKEQKWWYCPSIYSSSFCSALGCGDAFAGGFLSAYSKKLPIHLCLVYGTFSAFVATKVPNNMVAHWFYNELIEEIDILCENICIFLSAKSAYNYIINHKMQVRTLNDGLSNKTHLFFDWTYNLSTDS